MNVILIPEDPTRDRHILKPVIQAVLKEVGVPGLTVEMAPGNLGSVDAATDWENLEPIMDRLVYKTDLFLLCVDRDGKSSRRDTLDYLEQRARDKLDTEGFPDTAFFAIAAWQEVEVWALGGLRDHPSDWTWDDVRSDPDVKDTYFAEHARRRGVDERQFGGRKALAEESASNYRTLRQKCPELQQLEQRVTTWAVV